MLSVKYWQTMKPFAEGEMIKECLNAVVKIVFPVKKKIISNVNLSRRIEDLSENKLRNLFFGT